MTGLILQAVVVSLQCVKRVFVVWEGSDAMKPRSSKNVTCIGTSWNCLSGF